MIRILRILRASAAVQMRYLAADPFMLFSAVVQPFFIAVTVMYIVRARPDFDPVYVVVGAALSGLWTVTLFDGNWAINRERWQGTLELLVAAPPPFMLALGGRMIGSLLFSFVSVATSYVIGAWLFGYDIRVRDPLPFSVSFLLSLVSLWSIGMLLSPLGIMWRAASRFANILEYPVYILAGFMFPVLLLPGWTLPVSYVLPPYWAAVALHGTSSGEIEAPELLGVWAILVASTLIVVAIAHRLFDVVLVRARRDGTLALS